MGTLRKYRIDNSSCNIFIETGTGLGHSLRHALHAKIFEKLLSTEIHEETYLTVQKKFSEFKNVKISNKKSLEFLNDELPKIPTSKKILFYLDAHFPGEVSNGFNYRNNIHDETSFPLINELNSIKQIRPTSQDIIIIDDLCLFENGDFENGNVAEDFANIGQKTGIFDIESLFSDRKILRDYRDEGYLLILPQESRFELKYLSLIFRLKRSLYKNLKILASKN